MGYTVSMFSFFLKKPKEEITYCVCLVTDYAVSGAVVKVFHRPGAVQKPLVLFSYEVKIPLHATMGDNALDSWIIRATKEVLERCRSHQGVFDHLICTIGQPWVSDRMRIVHIEKKEPVEITKRMIQETLQRDLKIFEQEVGSDFGNDEVGIVGTSPLIFDAHGYRIQDPIGQKIKFLDMYRTYTVAPTQLVELLVGAFVDVFHRTDVLFQSESLATRGLISPHTQGTTLSVGGNSSMITSIDRGIVTGSMIIDEGLFDFEKNIRRLFDVAEIKIPSLMTLVEDGQFLEHDRDLFTRRINLAYQDLGLVIQEGLSRYKELGLMVTEPILLLGQFRGIKTLTPMISRSCGLDVVIPEEQYMHEWLVYAHTATVRNWPLTLAILQAVETHKINHV